MDLLTPYVGSAVLRRRRCGTRGAEGEGKEGVRDRWGAGGRADGLFRGGSWYGERGVNDRSSVWEVMRMSWLPD